jgi:hypothetical protein
MCAAMDIREESRRAALVEQRRRLALNLQRLDDLLRLSREYEADRERAPSERRWVPAPDMDRETLEEVRDTVVRQLDVLRLFGG